MTYRKLCTDSISLGKYLLKLGLSKGDKISFMMGNGYQTCRIFLGAMYAGFVVAPLNLKAQTSQLEFMVEHSDTDVRYVLCPQERSMDIDTPLDFAIAEFLLSTHISTK